MNIISHTKDEYNYGILMVEQPPSKRIINVVNNVTVETGSYFLSLPNIVFKIYYKETNENDETIIYFKGIKICVFIENQCYVPPFLNMIKNGEACLGKGQIKKETLEELIKECIKKWWGPFNSDLSHAFCLYKNKELSNYKEWEKKTKENPEWVPDSSHFIKMYEYDSKIFLSKTYF